MQTTHSAAPAVIPAGIRSELCSFFEVAFHCILHARRLYPEGLFEPKRKYGIVVHISRHPTLNQYIQQIIQAIAEWGKQVGKRKEERNMQIHLQNKVRSD
jgi:hypothetical protein